MKRFWVSLLAILALVASSAVPSLAEDSGKDFHLLSFSSTNMPPAYNAVYAWVENNTNSVPFSTDPFDTRTSEFDRQQVMREFKTVLPTCKSPADVGCLPSIEYSSDNGVTWNDAVPQVSPGQRDVAFGRIENGKWVFTYTNTYPAQPTKGIWQADQPNYWKLPGVEHALGDNYFINAVTRSEVSSNGIAKMTGIDFVAYAGAVRPMSIFDPCPYWGIQTNRNNDGYCFEAVNLPEQLLLRVKVNLGKRINELSGWFDGRLADAMIDFGTATPGQIVVQGKPVAVNIVQTVNIPKSDPDYNVSEEIEKVQLPNGTRGTYSPTNGVDDFIKYLSKIPDRALARNTNWRVSSWQQAGSLGNCKGKSGVQGVVLSNATTYESSPPKFNSAKASLDFKVASSHLNPNGDLNVGEYKLLVQQGLAECLWGTSMNGSATVSVVESSGVQDVATTSFKKANGWAIFYAAGFHYSVPTISVSFKKQSRKVVCVSLKNSKITKTISGTSPKCPAGYKQK